MFSVTRHHDISCGHRVVNHEGKCQFIHGHNYRIHFVCEPIATAEDVAKLREETGMSMLEARRGAVPKLDSVGRVVDFSVIKEKLCQWLEDTWDHKFLMWVEDPYLRTFEDNFPQSLVVLDFNPTAENMARFLVENVGPVLFDEYGVKLTKVVIEETRKCSATYVKD